MRMPDAGIGSVYYLRVYDDDNIIIHTQRLPRRRDITGIYTFIDFKK